MQFRSISSYRVDQTVENAILVLFELYWIKRLIQTPAALPISTFKRRESRESQKIYSRKSWIYKYLVEPLNNKYIKHVNHYYILFIPVYNIRRQQIVNFEQFEKKYLNYLGTILAFCYENRKKRIKVNQNTV